MIKKPIRVHVGILYVLAYTYELYLYVYVLDVELRKTEEADEEKE